MRWIMPWRSQSGTAHHFVAVRRAPGHGADSCRRSGSVSLAVFTAEDLARLRGELEKFVKGFAGDVPFTATVAEGNVVAEILRRATELAVDLVVMGTHGRSGFERLMLGSVTERVLVKRPAPC